MFNYIILGSLLAGGLFSYLTFLTVKRRKQLGQTLALFRGAVFSFLAVEWIAVVLSILGNPSHFPDNPDEWRIFLFVTIGELLVVPLIFLWIGSLLISVPRIIGDSAETTNEAFEN